MVLFPRVLAENPDRLMSDTGIQLRINRSIQVEGAFGVSYILKEVQLECGKSAFCYSSFYFNIMGKDNRRL